MLVDFLLCFGSFLLLVDVRQFGCCVRFKVVLSCSVSSG